MPRCTCTDATVRRAGPARRHPGKPPQEAHSLHFAARDAHSQPYRVPASRAEVAQQVCPNIDPAFFRTIATLPEHRRHMFFHRDVPRGVRDLPRAFKCILRLAQQRSKQFQDVPEASEGVSRPPRPSKMFEGLPMAFKAVQGLARLGRAIASAGFPRPNNGLQQRSRTFHGRPPGSFPPKGLQTPALRFPKPSEGVQAPSKVFRRPSKAAPERPTASRHAAQRSEGFQGPGRAPQTSSR